MSDAKLGVSVRTESDVDEKLQSKIVDSTTPTQGMVVDTDGNAHVELHGNNPAGADTVVKLSESGEPVIDGVYDATNNSDPSTSALVAHTRAATPAATDQVQRVTAVTSSTVHALDVSLHDQNGAPYTTSNPIPATVGLPGVAICDFNASSATAVDATVNHDYTVGAGVTFYLQKVGGSGSGRGKFLVSVETAALSGVFTTKAVVFGSGSSGTPNAEVWLAQPIAVATGVRVRVAKTNTDHSAQDLYSSIEGYTV